MDSNTDSQFNDDDIQKVIEKSKNEYVEMTNDKFIEQIQEAIKKSKEEFEENLSNLEKDQIDNFGIPSPKLTYMSGSDNEENNFNIEIKILPLSMYPWDDNIVDYLETTNNFIGTQDILNELNKNNLLEDINIISFKFDDSNILPVHKFIIGDTCFIPSNIYNDLHKKKLIKYNDNSDSFIDISFMNKDYDIGTSVIFETKNIDFIKIKDQKKLCEDNIIGKIKIINVDQKFYFFSKELNNYIEFVCKDTNTGRVIIITDTDLEINMTINDKVLKDYLQEMKEVESYMKESKLPKKNNNLNEKSTKEIAYDSKKLLDETNTTKISLSTSELRQRRVDFFNKITNI